MVLDIEAGVKPKEIIDLLNSNSIQINGRF